MNKLKRYAIISGTFSLLLANGCSLKNSDHSAHLRIEPATLSASPEPKKVLQSTLLLDQDTLIPATADVTQSKDSWQYLISLFSIPEEDNARIDQAIAWYLAHPNYIQIIQARAEPYLYAIIQEVEAKGLPGEFALLPAVESGFRAHAYSHASAAGLWQFIPSTGKLYGLEQNWWYDGRRDVYASTEAATSYLQNLGELFDHDWLLALASYNAGQGNVSRAIKRNLAQDKAIDFWSLDLPNETERYVPKLLALAKIFANAEHYGVELKELDHKPTFSAVDIGSQLDLSLAAKLSDTSLDELFQLNPGYNHAYTPPQGPHRLLIPIDKVEKFEQNLASLADQDRVQWQRHKVMPGDSLSRIASRYKTQIQVIQEVNHLPNNTIRAGSYLLIPLTQNQINNKSFIQTSQSPSNKQTTYTVKAGDSLWSIARKLELHSQDIANWNQIKLNEPLKLGQILVIKSNKATRKHTQKNLALKPIRYTVRSGDSLSTISEKFNVRITDLRRWNKKNLGKYLKPGQTLLVEVGNAQPST
ncbi:MAG: LysM peptidoglycan-binding domain-containing protein [Methyloprofundus sp.]|nr:LysM peptidoglycan-binding domain-containing protein [Methyloprofundus sp.]